MSASRYHYARTRLPVEVDVWEPLRRPEKPEPTSAPKVRPPRESLNARARHLLHTLPVGVSLEVTAEHYPHVVNRLATLWDDHRALSTYVDRLLMDDRADRQGFHFAALVELTAVKNLWGEARSRNVAKRDAASLDSE